MDYCIQLDGANPGVVPMELTAKLYLCLRTIWILVFSEMLEIIGITGGIRNIIIEFSNIDIL